MNLKTNQKGFTIVELLIVIVVIAILAAISIVAFTGIQQRAKTSKAQSNATSAQKVAEVVYANSGRYPDRSDDFSSGDAILPEGVTLIPGSATISAENGENSIEYRFSANGYTPTGARIRYWDFQDNEAKTVYLGNAADVPESELRILDWEY